MSPTRLGRVIQRMKRQFTPGGIILLPPGSPASRHGTAPWLFWRRPPPRREASESIQVLAAYTLREAQIENLVTAKGYEDCVAFMSDGSLSVVVSTENGELQTEDVARITDIAMTESGLPASSIKIMAAN